MGFFSELFNGLVSEKFLVKTTKKRPTLREQRWSGKSLYRVNSPFAYSIIP